MILFGDVETTGINPYCSEVIEGYFELHENGKAVKTYLLQSQVNAWSDEAETIHGISKKQMQGFKSKRQAWEDFLSWLPSEFTFCCYVNSNTQLGNVWFDSTVIQMEIMNHLGVDRVEQQPFNPKRKINVYDMARAAAKKGLYTPVKNVNTGRASYTLENVFKALYGEYFNAHNAKADVQAMIKIYYDLLKAEQFNTDIKREQLSLL